MAVLHSHPRLPVASCMGKISSRDVIAATSSLARTFRLPFASLAIELPDSIQVRHIVQCRSRHRHEPIDFQGNAPSMLDISSAPKFLNSLVNVCFVDFLSNFF